MKTEILKLLREHDGYVSGQEICQQFQVSRTAVWKVINQLKEDGYQIEAVRNKGYCITKCPEVLSKEELESLMDTQWAGKAIVYYETTDSTNVRAKRLAEEGAEHGMLVVADRQESGKGRRGRSWDSPRAGNIYMSLLIRPDFSPIKAPMLTLVMAYSVAQVILKKEELNVKIKWPNDIVLNKKKVCGILTEMSAEIDYVNHVVIGVGMNVNEKEMAPEYSQTGTSLYIEGKQPVKRGELVAEIMKAFEENYELFLKTEDLSGIQDGYNQLLINEDRDVLVLEPGQEYQAHALGINRHGELMVRKEDGTIENIFAGEVSVRGVYGYV